MNSNRLSTAFVMTILLVTILYSFAHANPPAELPVTGQSSCYDTAGTVISCSGTGQDGDIRAGIAWPVPRFTDNGNGTVTDNLTGLIWLKNANCTTTVGGIYRTSGNLTWENAFTWINALRSGYCGLTDASVAGQWRLPNLNELESLIDEQTFFPSLPIGHPFASVQTSYYWSSSSYTNYAWVVSMYEGSMTYVNKTTKLYVWPVRAGQ